jgi:flavodoxin/NAD-dependent dihydropyrimidine dehydrogenase PreA subunit
MKSIVIYFSQTGNTEEVARSIQAGITQATGHCDLKEIREAHPLSLGGYDLIGVGSPVIGQCPENVLEFFRRLQFVGGKHAFTFCTHGTGHRRFYPSLYPVLAERGLTVIGSGDWYGDCYLLHMPQPYPTAGHPDATDLKDAETFGRDMAVRSMRIRSGETDLIPPAPEPLAPMAPSPVEPGEAPSPNAVGTFTELLKFDKGKCLYPNCTLCVDNCPTYGMDLSVDPPVLAKPCIDCEFCARLCPTGALDMTPWLEAMEDMTVGAMPRMLGSLEQAEKGGQFRRLIPLSEIDTTRTGYKQYMVHPQWVLGKGPQKSEGLAKNVCSKDNIEII